MRAATFRPSAPLWEGIRDVAPPVAPIFPALLPAICTHLFDARGADFGFRSGLLGGRTVIANAAGHGQDRLIPASLIRNNAFRKGRGTRVGEHRQLGLRGLADTAASRQPRSVRHRVASQVERSGAGEAGRSAAQVEGPRSGGRRYPRWRGLADGAPPLAPGHGLLYGDRYDGSGARTSGTGCWARSCAPHRRSARCT